MTLNDMGVGVKSDSGFYQGTLESASEYEDLRSAKGELFYNPVPVPAGIWLFLGGLLPLFRKGFIRLVEK